MELEGPTMLPTHVYGTPKTSLRWWEATRLNYVANNSQQVTLFAAYARGIGFVYESYYDNCYAFVPFPVLFGRFRQ